MGFPPDVQINPCQHNRETVNRSISTVIIQGLIMAANINNSAQRFDYARAERDD
jgi:hypothetical protein